MGQRSSSSCSQAEILSRRVSPVSAPLVMLTLSRYIDRLITTGAIVFTSPKEPTSSSAPPRSRRSHWRLIGAVAVLLAMVVPSAVSADGHDVPDGVTDLGEHDGWTAFSGRVGFLYGWADDAYFAFAGDPVDVVCSSEPPQTLGMTRQEADGTWTTKIPFGGVERTVYVYENTVDADIFVFLDTVCPAIGAGEEPPAPFAVGQVTQRAKSFGITETGYWDFVSIGQPSGHYWNTIGGLAYDSEGNGYRVFAEARYDLGDMGPDFSSTIMSVRPAG